MNSAKGTAIVYDWIDKWGGVERVLLALSEIFPEADFFTSYYDKEGAAWAKNLKIKTSFVDKLPRFIKKGRITSFPFYSYVFESFDFSAYDLVVSVTSSFAKSVITKPGTQHLCYLLTPTRYLWIQPENYFQNNFIFSLIKPYINCIKNWDLVVAQRPDKIISISQTVADRCQRYYKRKSKVVYPPFDVEYWKQVQSAKFPSARAQGEGKVQSYSSKFKVVENKRYFLVVSRLEPYKKIDLVINVFNQLALQSKNRSHQDCTSLIIVGGGSQEKKLKKIAGGNIYFYNKLTDEELGCLYSRAQALIMPQEEDFGYVSLEAQFFGCPVIAYKKGGATETVIAGKTGLFFDSQTKESLIKALERFEAKSYNIRTNTKKFGPENVERFDKRIFNKKFNETISNITTQNSNPKTQN